MIEEIVLYGKCGSVDNIDNICFPYLVAQVNQYSNPKTLPSMDASTTSLLVPTERHSLCYHGGLPLRMLVCFPNAIEPPLCSKRIWPTWPTW